MTDRPIIFSAPMVRALLEGRKTQTRRGLKPPYGTLEYLHDGTWRPICTKFFRGDRLWVREAWSGPYMWRDMPPSKRASCGSPLALHAWHWADGNPTDGDWERPRPSIHMPRWASRLTLIVTDVLVHRLQEISEADAASEGVAPLHEGYFPYGLATFVTTTVDGKEVPAQYCPTARLSFERLWNSLHGPDAWAANPWVCALTFRVIRANIDSPEAAQC